MRFENTELIPLLNRSRLILVGAAILLAGVSVTAQENNLLQRADVKAAFQYLDRDFDRFVAELVTLTEIPAPPTDTALNRSL